MADQSCAALLEGLGRSEALEVEERLEVVRLVLVVLVVSREERGVRDWEDMVLGWVVGGC